MLTLLLLLAGCTRAPGAAPAAPPRDDTDAVSPPSVDTGADVAVDTPPDVPPDDCFLDPSTGPGLAEALASWREASWQWMTCAVSASRCLDAAGASFVCIAQAPGEVSVTTCYRESDGAPVWASVMSDVAEFCGGTSYRLSGGVVPACVTQADSADLEICPPACGAQVTWEAVPVAPQCADGPRGDAFVEPEPTDRRGPPPPCVPLVWQAGVAPACVAVEGGQLVEVGADGTVTALGVAVVFGSVALDVDGDGALDLASPSANGVRLARGGALREVWVTGGAVSALELAGDLDGDGVVDLLAHLGPTTAILRADTPVGTALQSLPALTGEVRPFGDLDGDGVDEVASESAGVTTVLSRPWLPGAPTWSGPAALRRAGDVDGDGAPDLLSADSVWFGPPSGPQLSALPRRPARAVADVDGDGQADLLLSEPGVDRRTCAVQAWEPVPVTRPTMTLSWLRGPVARSPSPGELPLGRVVAPIDDVADVRAERGGLIVQRGDWRAGDSWWWCPPSP